MKFSTAIGAAVMAVVVVVAAFATATAGPKDPKGPKGPKGPKNPPVESPAPTSDPTVSETPSSDPEPPGTSAEAEFMAMMIPHHFQAVLMSELAPDRASDPDVLALADRILAEQRLEIDTMQRWQEFSGEPVTDEVTAYEMMLEMPMMLEQMGMASAAEMDQLAASSGGAFDRLYLELMIPHHEGAVRMLADVMSNGSDQFVLALAGDMLTTQNVQLWDMERMLADMG